MRSVVYTPGTIRLSGHHTRQRGREQFERGNQMGASSVLRLAVIRIRRTGPAAVASDSRVLPIQVRVARYGACAVSNLRHYRTRHRQLRHHRLRPTQNIYFLTPPTHGRRVLREVSDRL